MEALPRPSPSSTRSSFSVFSLHSMPSTCSLSRPSSATTVNGEERKEIGQHAAWLDLMRVKTIAECAKRDQTKSRIG